MTIAVVFLRCQQPESPGNEQCGLPHGTDEQSGYICIVDLLCDAQVGGFACGRYAKSQREQLLGQAIGLPLFMAAFTFVGLAVTSATITIFGTAISDPILLLSKMKGFLPLVLAPLGVNLLRSFHWFHVWLQACHVHDVR